jgi:two-component system copper resistance phosphate regulon response regulator CusR
MRLLLVEDDVAIQGFLGRALVEAGYQADAASNAKTGELKALEGSHDAFIIDLGLPDMDGLDLIARCRAQGSSAPVLILSARRSVDDRVRGLEQGGDDVKAEDAKLPGAGISPKQCPRKSAAENVRVPRLSEISERRKAGRRREHFLDCWRGSVKLTSGVTHRASGDSS